jgi:hypothetical protein
MIECEETGSLPKLPRQQGRRPDFPSGPSRREGVPLNVGTWGNVQPRKSPAKKRV